MKRESLIFFLGFLIVLMPFIGVPNTWKRISYIVCGLLLMLVGYQLRRLAYMRSIEDHTGERKTDVYVEQVEQLFSDQTIKAVVQNEPQEEHIVVPKPRSRRRTVKNV